MVCFKEGGGIRLEPYWHFGWYLFFQDEHAFKNCQQLLGRLQQTQRTLPTHPTWLVFQFKFCDPGLKCSKLYYYLNLEYQMLLPAIPLAFRGSHEVEFSSPGVQLTNFQQGHAVQDCRPDHLDCLRGEQKLYKENDSLLPAAVAFPCAALLSDHCVFLLRRCLLILSFLWQRNTVLGCSVMVSPYFRNFARRTWSNAREIEEILFFWMSSQSAIF